MPGRRGAAALLAAALLAAGPASGGWATASTGDGSGETAAQDDAGSGGDAGDSFAAATPIEPVGEHAGALDRHAGDTDDYYRFALAEGASATVLLTFLEAPATEPVTILDPNEVPVDSGVGVLSAGITASAAATTELAGVRLAVHHAAVPGEYRLHISGRNVDVGAYEICFMICEGPQDAPIEFVFGGSLPKPSTRVLLVPPSHGDLGNPGGPTVLDYIDATLRGMHRWVDALHAFADDHPELSYLKQITVDIEIFDGFLPIYLDGYDVVVGYVAAGPAFRGVASNSGQLLNLILDWGGTPRFSGRVIALSLFGASPRAGQVLWDYPEVSDLESVTMHEFGHTFGLGHTRTWHHEHGPDLMNSPATFVYGDGLAAGDGGERTPLFCFSSLDLYGMAVLYRWLPSGRHEPTWGSTSLPDDIPYRLYC